MWICSTSHSIALVTCLQHYFQRNLVITKRVSASTVDPIFSCPCCGSFRKLKRSLLTLQLQLDSTGNLKYNSIWKAGAIKNAEIFLRCDRVITLNAVSVAGKITDNSFNRSSAKPRWYQDFIDPGHQRKDYVTAKTIS